MITIMDEQKGTGTLESAEKRAKELNDALGMALVAIDTLIEAKPMIAAKVCGSTTLGNLRVEIRAVLHGR
jgi:hypothetical protein